MSTTSTEHDKLDGVQLAVLGNRFEAVVRAMMNTLVRTGRSGVLNTARDFSCCVLTKEAELLAMAESLPIHVMRGPDIMARWMKELHPSLRSGDAFLHNSPYHGNSHAADHCILVPVVDEDAEHQFTVLAKAHQADCGNALPATYIADARDVYEEGALIFPCVKVQSDYRDIDDIIRICKMRIRVPEQWWGDHLALLGAARSGERKLLELGSEVGWETLHAYTRGWLDYSEQRMIAAIRQLPAGRVVVNARHDPFPRVPEGIPIRVGVEIDPQAGLIDVDLRDNPDSQPCGLNLSEACSLCSALVGVFNGMHYPVPPNAGSFRRVRVHLRENCVVGIPLHPTSCSVATTNVLDRAANAVQRALAELGEGHGMAETGLSFPPSVGVISGRDPRFGNRPFVNQLVLAWTSGAASPVADGWLTSGGVSDGGVLLRDSVEVDELKHPIRILEQRIIPDTEGAGRFRGAPGALLEYGPVDCSLVVMYLSDGSVNPAMGVRGGLPGACARQYKRTTSGELIPLDACGHVELNDGEMILSMSCGGGGYGSPGERDPERVRHDVSEGWITAERARLVYGVVLDDEGNIDIASTRKLRGSATEPEKETSA